MGITGGYDPAQKNSPVQSSALVTASASPRKGSLVFLPAVWAVRFSSQRIDLETQGTKNQQLTS